MIYTFLCRPLLARLTQIALSLSLFCLVLWVEPAREATGEPIGLTDSSAEQVVPEAGLAPRPTRGPIRIKSDRMEAMDQTGRVLFSGEVVATRDNLTIYADQLEVFYVQDSGSETEDSQKRRVREIVASGHVRITQRDIVASGQQAVYDKPSEKIVLTGDAQVWQGENRVRGERITVYLNEDRSVAEGNPEQKVEAVVYPAE